MSDPIMNPDTYRHTLEQKFTLHKMQMSLEKIKSHEKDKIILDAMKLIMVKDNIIKSMIEKWA